MLKHLAIAALGASLLTGPAQARQSEPQEGPPRGPRPDLLGMADTNKDGIVTRDEVLANAAARFKAMDTNQDGKVTPEERAAFQSTMGIRMGGRMPRARNDLTLAEEQARAGRMFDRIDTNHDGRIDAAERDAAADRMRSMRRFGGRRGQLPPANGADAPTPPPASGN